MSQRSLNSLKPLTMLSDFTRPTSVQPIKTLRWIAAEALTKKNAAFVTAAVKEWLTTGAFNAVSVGLLPPTFVDLQESISLVNQLNEVAGGRLIVGMFPVGREGWETSFNERFAERLAPLGIQFDNARALVRDEWLDRIRKIEAPVWAYVLEQPARRPTAEEVESSVKAFVQCARKENKQVVLWLSAMMLRNPTDIETVRRVWRQVGGQVDYVVWMDLLLIVAQEPGRSLESLLDLALSLTPKEKAVVQWNHNSKLMTKDSEGTLRYIATCQAKGIHRFVVLANPALLQNEPWATFYRGLRRKH